MLLVEDDEVNQEIESLMLERLGFTVDVVADGAAAVHGGGRGRLLGHPHGLPPARAWTATRRRRAIRGREAPDVRVPIIGLSAHTRTGSAASRPAWTTTWPSPSLSTRWHTR